VILLFILLLFRVIRKRKYFTIPENSQRHSVDINASPKEGIVEEHKGQLDVLESEDYVKTGPSTRDKRFKKRKSPWDLNPKAREYNLKRENESLKVENSKLRRIIAHTVKKVSVSELRSLSRKELIANSVYVMNTIYLRCC
jgi:hypothetical protein